MKILLPALLLLFFLASCKKEQPPVTSNSIKDTVVTYQPPTITKSTITSISPDSGTVGTVVTITGTNFGYTAAAYFNGVAGTVQSVTATEIKVIAPKSVSGNVSVTTNSQTIIGPVFTYAAPVITKISPASGTYGTIVTIAGTNFGTSTIGVIVLFNGKAGTVQSVTPTEIKVFVPVTTTGNITVTLGNQSVTGPVFTYHSIFDSPYTSGSVTLTTQAEVDQFVNQNKGRQLQITGGILTISGVDITSVSGLSNITSVSGSISILACPLLTDVSFLNNITSTGSILIQNLAVSAIAMDKLASLTSYIAVSSCKNLNSLSFKAVTSNSGLSSLQITSCDQLSRMDFGSLESIPNGLIISGTAITDLTGFGSLQTVGSLTLSNNPSLINFHGLERLTTLTLPGINWIAYNKSLAINGLYITGNPKLTSLSGLQNLTSVPIARITGNATLNDFCPLKAPITQLSTLPKLTVTANARTADALTLSGNGNYATTTDALAAIKLCN